jgi:hypothetical protein
MKTSFLPSLPRFAFAPILSLLTLAASPQAFAADSFDFGDLPAPYPTKLPGGARHELGTSLRLGALADTEADGTDAPGAQGDDAAGADDEDGLAVLPRAIPGLPVTLLVKATNASAGPAFLHAYADWDHDGTFDGPSERVTAVVAAGLVDAEIAVAMQVPLTAVPAPGTALRLRLASAQVLPSGGPAADGEVEDYLLPVEVPLDYGDHPASYDADVVTGPARHAIGGVHTIHLGETAPDPEAQPQPDDGAFADDAAGSHDEDHGILGVTVEPGEPTYATVTVRPADWIEGTVRGFVDWNNDGDFADPGEDATATVPPGLGAGGLVRVALRWQPISLSPIVHMPNGIYFRCRLRVSTQPGGGPTGLLPDGEVEDTFLSRILNGYDFGSLPDLHPGTRPGGAEWLLGTHGQPVYYRDVMPDYRTRAADGGPVTTRSRWLYLESIERRPYEEECDHETDSSGQARADATTGIDDDQGVDFSIMRATIRQDSPSRYTGTETATISLSVAVSASVVNTLNSACVLQIFADTNLDGIFSATERWDLPVPAFAHLPGPGDDGRHTFTQMVDFTRVLQKPFVRYEVLLPVRVRLSAYARGSEEPNYGETEDHVLLTEVQFGRWWPEPENEHTFAQRLTGTLVKGLPNRLSAAAMSGRPGPHAGAVWRVGEHVFTQENPELPPSLLDAITSGQMPWLLTLPGVNGPEHFAGEFQIEDMPEYRASVSGLSKPGLMEDADGDGVSNFAEVAFGTDPATVGKPAPSIPMQDTGGNPILLYLEHEPRPSTAGEVIVFEYLPQISHDLTSWNTAEPHPVPSGLPTPPVGYHWKAARAPASSTPGAPAFLRVNASPP